MSALRQTTPQISCFGLSFEFCTLFPITPFPRSSARVEAMAPATRAKGITTTNLVDLINSSPAGKKKAADKERKEAERKAAEAAKKAEKLEAAKAKKSGKKSAEKEVSTDYSMYDKETAILLKQSDAQIAFNADKADHYSDLLAAINPKKHADAIPLVKAKVTRYTSYVDALRTGRTELLNSATPPKGKKKATVPDPSAFISSGEYLFLVFCARSSPMPLPPPFFLRFSGTLTRNAFFSFLFYENLYPSNPLLPVHHTRTTPSNPFGLHASLSTPRLFSSAMRLLLSPRRQRRCTGCDPPSPRNRDALVPTTTPTKTGLRRRCLPPSLRKRESALGAYHQPDETGSTRCLPPLPQKRVLLLVPTTTPTKHGIPPLPSSPSSTRRTRCPLLSLDQTRKTTPNLSRLPTLAILSRPTTTNSRTAKQRDPQPQHTAPKARPTTLQAS
jgi:hypothetical protein